jgi:hypothetical protein
MTRIYVGNRRKSNEELQSVTITLPKSVLVELSNYGVESGRGSGNMSVFLEAASLIVAGLFNNPEIAKENIQKLVRVDIDTEQTLRELSESLRETADRLSVE